MVTFGGGKPSTTVSWVSRRPCRSRRRVSSPVRTGRWRVEPCPRDSPC